MSTGNFIDDLCDNVNKAIDDSKKVDSKQLAIEMDSQIKDLINDYEIMTGWTVEAFEIHRVSDHRSAVTSVKPFVFFSVPNRQLLGDQDV